MISTLDVNTIDNLELLPKLRLQNLHICTQLNETKQSINQIASNKKGSTFITAILLNTIDSKEKASLSTQAFCNHNIDGFIILKLGKTQKIEWIKHIKQKAIPLNISSISKNKIAITGIHYSENTPNDQLFYLILDENGNPK